MKKNIERNYLEINSIQDLKETVFFSDDYSVQLVEPVDFQLNKFFYKRIGKNHRWIDRLTWTDKQWIEYTSGKTVKTYILKKKKIWLDISNLFFMRIKMKLK